MSNQIKRGRKSKPYVASWGEHINGLRRRAHDKRWILSDGRTFAENDERKAIERFLDMMGEGETKAERSERNRELPMTRPRMIQWARSYILDTPLLAAKELGIEWIGVGD